MIGQSRSTTCIRAWPDRSGSSPFPRPHKGFCEGTVDGHITEIESDDLVKAMECLFDQVVNTPALIHSSRRAQSVVSETFTAEPLGIPRNTPWRADEHHVKAVPVENPMAVTAEWMGTRRGNERFYPAQMTSPTSKSSAHDVGDLHESLLVGSPTRLSRVQPNDWWMSSSA